ncbi:MAG: helix-turn-helix domain-containing protein [Oligoflexales bacterium]|nr:helix-turn-helix domain-containing protein [Oligoflexales bacterium]
MEEKKKEGAGRPIHIPEPWGQLAEAVGGTQKLAQKLGVSGATVNRWANGVHKVPELAKREIRRMCKYYGIETTF